MCQTEPQPAARHDTRRCPAPLDRIASPGGQSHGIHDTVIVPAVLLAAFGGLRLAEACGLCVTDVDFMRGVIRPTLQFSAEELKADTAPDSALTCAGAS